MFSRRLILNYETSMKFKLGNKMREFGQYLIKMGQKMNGTMTVYDTSKIILNISSKKS